MVWHLVNDISTIISLPVKFSLISATGSNVELKLLTDLSVMPSLISLLLFAAMSQSLTESTSSSNDSNNSCTTTLADWFAHIGTVFSSDEQRVSINSCKVITLCD